MSEEVARALGVPAADEEVVGGKVCKLRPLTLRELAALERECVKWYRAWYLDGFEQGARRSLGDAAEGAILRRVEEAARWDVADLPSRIAADPRGMRVTDALRSAVIERLGIEGEPDDDRLARLTAAALDQGVLSVEDYVGLVGEPPRRVRVPFDRWWVSGCHDGRIAIVAACFGPYGVTKEEVEAEYSSSLPRLMGTVRRIEVLTAIAVGNAEGPTP